MIEQTQQRQRRLWQMEVSERESTELTLEETCMPVWKKEFSIEETSGEGKESQTRWNAFEQQKSERRLKDGKYEELDINGSEGNFRRRKMESVGRWKG